MYKVGVVIVNYNTYDELIECVDSIEKNTVCDYTIYIVDNHSKPEIQKKISNKYGCYSRIVLMFLDENVGYSGGNNEGIKAAIKDGYKYVAIVNSDIVIKNDIFSIMCPQINDLTVAVGPQVIDLDGRDGQHLIKTYNYLAALLDRHPFYWINRLCKYGYISSKTIHSSVEFEGMVSGCCFLIDLSKFIEMGLFDDNVFLYSEERILSIKMKKTGVRVCYEPKACVVHKEGKSTKKRGSAFSDYHRYASDYYTVVRYCKVKGLKKILFRTIRLAVFWLKSVKDKSYVSEYKRLKIKFNEIDKGIYKICA